MENKEIKEYVQIKKEIKTIVWKGDKLNRPKDRKIQSTDMDRHTDKNALLNKFLKEALDMEIQQKQR